jgi:hypothetical protein
MAGLMFFEDREVIFKFPHIIASNDARNLVGTIYLPGNTLEINSNETHCRQVGLYRHHRTQVRHEGRARTCPQYRL